MTDTKLRMNTNLRIATPFENKQSVFSPFRKGRCPKEEGFAKHI